MAIPVFPTVDKWPLRPFDPKCKKFVPFDPVVDDQIRCKVPLWGGDFSELKPELTAEGQGLRLADLPLLTVYDVGQYVIRAAQGGSLRAGPIGTAAHTIVGLLPSNGIAEENGWHAHVARGLESTPRRVLWFMLEHNAHSATSKVTRQLIADRLRVSIDDVQAAGGVFSRLEKPLIESVDGCKGGWWLSPDGNRVAERCAACVTPVAVLTQSRKAK
jgi:hypothetical protein